MPFPRSNPEVLSFREIPARLLKLIVTPAVVSHGIGLSFVRCEHLD